jgi:hypothetical protein
VRHTVMYLHKKMVT